MARSLLEIGLTMAGVSVLVFILGKVFVPGDAVTFIVGSEGGDPDRVARIRAELGLDRSLLEQYLLWATGLLRGDFGISPVSGRAVADDITKQLPVSLGLALYVSFTALLIGLPLGVVAGLRHGSWIDRILRGSLMVAFSVPVFVTGVLLVLASGVGGWAWALQPYRDPSSGLIPHVQTVLLPTLTMAVPVAAIMMQLMRTSTLEITRKPYIRTAYAKGLSRRRIVFVHILRNALGPVVTVMAFQFGALIGGLIVVEQVFGIPGVGRGLLAAIGQRDFSYLMAATMIFAGIFVASNRLADVIYPFLEPAQRRTVPGP